MSSAIYIPVLLFMTMTKYHFVKKTINEKSYTYMISLKKDNNCLIFVKINEHVYILYGKCH